MASGSSTTATRRRGPPVGVDSAPRPGSSCSPNNSITGSQRPSTTIIEAPGRPARGAGPSGRWRRIALISRIPAGRVPVARKIAAGVMAAGALSLGFAGVAGATAAAPSTTTSAPSTPTTGAPTTTTAPTTTAPTTTTTTAPTAASSTTTTLPTTAPSTTTPPSNSPPASGLPLFNCVRATRVLTRIQREEARIAARLPKLSAREARAAEKGHVRVAALLKKLIARLESSKVGARLTRRAAAIEAECHVSAPAA